MFTLRESNVYARPGIARSIMLVIMVYAFLINIGDKILNQSVNGIAFCLLLVFLCSLYALLSIRTSLAFPLSWISFYMIILIKSFNLFKNNNFYWISIYTCLTFVFVLLCNKTEWIDFTIKIVIIFSLANVFATLIFAVMPNSFYIATMYKLWGFYPLGTDNGLAGFRAALTSHYSSNGIYCMIAVLLNGSIIIAKNSLTKTMPTNKSIVLFVFSLIALLLTTKRAHLLFSLCTLAIVYYIGNPEKKSSRIMNILMLTIIMIIPLYFISMFTPSLAGTFSRFFEQDDISSGRFQFWSQAWDLFKENPLLGIGWTNYNNYNIYGTNVHNTYLQLLCETGLIGFSVIFYTMVNSLAKSICFIRKLKNSIPEIYADAIFSSISIQIFILLYCLTGNCLYDMTVFFYYVACIISYSIRLKFKSNMGRLIIHKYQYDLRCL